MVSVRNIGIKKIFLPEYFKNLSWLALAVFLVGSLTLLIVAGQLKNKQELRKKAAPPSEGLESGGYCVSTGSSGQVCIDLFVNGNQHEESMDDYWPLVENSTWRFEGVRRKLGENIEYKLQIIAKAPEIYEGQAVTPLEFRKSRIEGYWQPDVNQDLKWMVVNFDQSNYPYIWAKGDERYTRGINIRKEDGKYINNCARRFEYLSLTDGVPPYLLLPRKIDPNPTNNGLVNSKIIKASSKTSCMGSSCQNSCNNGLTQYAFNSSWFMGVTDARIKVPAFGDRWLEAKRIEVIELGIQATDEVTAPYQDNRELICGKHYPGVREDYYLVKDVGIVLIFTRDVEKSPDWECIYDVARQPLTFTNADTYDFLVQKDYLGYRPNFLYPSPLPTSTLTSTPIPIPTGSQMATATPTIPQSPTHTPTPRVISAPAGAGNCYGMYFGEVQCKSRAAAQFPEVNGTCQLNSALGTIDPDGPNYWRWSYCE